MHDRHPQSRGAKSDFCVGFIDLAQVFAVGALY